MPETNFEENGFVGIDAVSAPENLMEGEVQQAENLLLITGTEGRGGWLQARPGSRAQLDTDLTLPPAGQPFCYRRADGTNVLVGAIGNENAGDGKIVAWVEGATTVTDITPAGVLFEVGRVSFARIDDFLFISGSVSGKLYRTKNPVVTLTEATGPARPTRKISAARGNRNLGLTNWNNGTKWDYDRSGATDIALTNPDFLLGAGGLQDWNVSGTAETATFNTRTWLRLDDPPTTVSHNPVTVPDKTDALSTGGATRHPLLYGIGFAYWQDRTADTITVTLTLYDSGSLQLASITKEVNGNETGVEKYANLLFDFSSILSDDAGIDTIELTLGAGAQNVSGAVGPYVSNFSSIRILDGIPAGSDLIVSASGAGIRSAFFSSEPSAVPTGGMTYTHDLGATKDFSTLSTLLVGYREPVTLENVRIRLGLHTLTSDAPAWTGEGELITDQGQSYLSFNILGIDPAVLAAVQYLDFQILESPSIANSGVYASGQVALFLTGLFASGELTPGGIYDYRHTELSDYGTADQLESPAGTASGQVQATSANASVNLTWNGSLPETTLGSGTLRRIAVWRRGGTVSDGFWHLVAVFTAGSDSSDPDLFWEWDHTTGIFIDRTPDAVLQGTRVLIDYDPTPANLHALAPYAGRLAAVTDTELYLSHLTQGASVGTRWTIVNDTTSPDYPETQGLFTPVVGRQGASGGRILNIATVRSRLALFLTGGKFIFGGTDALSFRLQEQENDKGIGLAARNALTVYDGACIYLAKDGLRAWDLENDEIISDKIRRYLNPRGALAGAALNAQGYGRSSVFVHANRLCLAAPTSGSGTAIGAVYALDKNEGGSWTRLLLGDVRGGIAFSEGGEEALYLLTADGQIRAFGSVYGDKATTGGSVTGVPITLMTRRYRIKNYETKPNRLYPTIYADTPTTVTFSVWQEEDIAHAYSLAYDCPAGLTTVRTGIPLPSRLRGEYVTVQVTATATGVFQIRRLRLVAAAGRPL